MMNAFPAWSCLFMVLAAIAAVPPAVAQAPAPSVKRAETPPDRAQLERRLQSVKTLIETSSAARQIEAGDHAGAQAKRNDARQVWRHAQESFDAGDLRSASSLLDDAARQIFEGTRMLAGEREITENLAAAIATRMEGARALLAAQKRISAEKSGAGGGAETARRIEAMLDEAKAHLAAQHIAQARPLVEQAYLMAKASIGTMRGGDTLVRSLNFSSKEEEYHYEVDRNDTHRMLLQMLAQKQPGDAGASRAFVERAADLRRDADSAGRRGDYVNAIRLLEEATRELVRAIRGAGVFIQG